MNMSTSLAVIVALTAVISWGCSGGSTPGTDAKPPPESGSVMAVEPRALQPGDAFSASFEDSNFRGGYFHLSAWSEGTWSEGTWSDPLYLLESDANGGPATAVKMLDEGLEVQDYGVSGHGPDGLVLPSDITAGIWRICTANARDSACAQFEVDGSG